MMNEKKIVTVYDYFGPLGEIPNGLNYFYMNRFVDSNFDFMSINKTMSINPNSVPQDEIGVWISGLEMSLLEDEKIGINEVEYDLSVIYLYPISIFGNGYTVYGKDDFISNGMSFFEFISDKALDYLKTKKNFYLIIDHPMEGVVTNGWFDWLYNLMREYHIPYTKVIYQISDFTLEKTFTKWYNSKNLSKTPKINLLSSNWSLHTKKSNNESLIQKRKNNNNFVSKSDLSKKKLRRYKFICFNKRIRRHRIESIMYFYQQKIMDEMLISYDLTEQNKEYIQHRDSILHNLKSRQLQKIIKNPIQTFKNLIYSNPKMNIDFQNILDLNGINYNYETKYPYLNSYIHIISETNFYEEGLYLSEKTWKPIMNLQPFLFIGPPGSLEQLKKLGFKTFSPFIDEKYDSITDDEQRMRCVMQEIKRLSNLTLDEIHEWYNSIQDILIHNYDLFYSYELLKNHKIYLKRKINQIHEKINTKFL